ncbi:MAG: hypothetical protein HY855_11005 [Burkholderiales bacterium]|nr:hypothetical protein [Burkholderiales bacterium]
MIDVRPGECLELAGARVEVVHKSGRVARLRVTAPREMPIKVLDAQREISSAVDAAVVTSTAG